MQDAINANVVNGQHFGEQEIVRFFKGTCEAVRAMHSYRPPSRSAGPPPTNGANGSSSSNPRGNGSAHPQKKGGAGRHSHDEDERFPQPEGDADGGYSYEVNDNSSSVPLVKGYGVESDGEVVFDGDEEAAQEAADSSSEAPIVPYAHKDLKPG